MSKTVPFGVRSAAASARKSTFTACLVLALLGGCMSPCQVDGPVNPQTATQVTGR